jgi:sec-independent protein translocase protein TatA
MPNIGPFEVIVILIIALLVIGPGRLPEVGAALGKSIREFRKATSDVTEAARVDAPPAPPASPAPPAAAVPVTPAPGMSPTAAPAPTPEPMGVTPTATTVPAPVPMPQAPGDDETDPAP